MDFEKMFRLALITIVVVVLAGTAFAIGYKAGNEADVSISIGSVAKSTVAPTTQPADTPPPPTSSNTPPSPSPEQEQTQASEPTQTQPLIPEPTQEQETPATMTDEEALHVLREVWNLVDEEYYGELPSPEDRVYGAIRGMLGTLGDDYTSFLYGLMSYA